jgi:hypothetical protein
VLISFWGVTRVTFVTHVTKTSLFWGFFEKKSLKFFFDEICAYKYCAQR